MISVWFFNCRINPGVNWDARTLSLPFCPHQGVAGTISVGPELCWIYLWHDPSHCCCPHQLPPLLLSPPLIIQIISEWGGGSTAGCCLPQSLAPLPTHTLCASCSGQRPTPRNFFSSFNSACQSPLLLMPFNPVPC